MKTLIETIEEIEKAAKDATSGRWNAVVELKCPNLDIRVADNYYVYVKVDKSCDPDGQYPRICTLETPGNISNHGNAEFIALCNPSEVLKLTQALRVANETLKHAWVRIHITDPLHDKIGEALSKIAAIYEEELK